jgi:hypothetical protein
LPAVLLGVWTAGAAGEPLPHRAGSLAKEEPQAVYAPDPADAWNRLFYCCFTRTVRTHLSEDFPEGAPFDPVNVMGRPGLPVSTRLFERIEGGDRSLEPFYPSFFTLYGRSPFRLWVQPRYAPLKKTLEDALQEKLPRSPLARALMQGDVWAAYDRLSRFEEVGREAAERRQKIVALLARFAKKLALPPQEIQALPDNYATAARAHQLPDLFGADSPWLEVRWFAERVHDEAADQRRVARVFLKPAVPPADKLAFLNGLPGNRSPAEQLEGVALVVQNLLIDRGGQVTATPLTYEVQLRRFVRDRDGKVVRAEVNQYELSRRLLRSDPRSGGLEALDRTAPVYAASGGNDLDFASDGHTPLRQPVLVRLSTRCTLCHGKNTEAVFTFDLRPAVPPPPVALLKPSENEHARDVIRRKVDRKDFKALQECWREE